MRDWIRMAHERAGKVPINSSPDEFHQAPASRRVSTGHMAFEAARHINQHARSFTMQPSVWHEARPPERAIVEVKYDGIPLLFKDGRGITREGVDFTATSHLWGALNRLNEVMLKHHVFHGEYVNPMGFEATLADMQRGVGSGYLMLFDAVPRDAYWGHVRSAPLHERRRALEQAYMRIGGVNMFAAGVALVKQSFFVGDARDNIEIAAGEAWAGGLEGIIVKDADSPYVRDESEYWMKIKRVETIDVPIHSRIVEEGRLRAIIVQAKRNGPPVTVGVGFSQKQRAAPEDFRPGRMVEIKHLGATAKESLRSASFVRFRDDKA